MANPQPDKYTKFSNELLEALAKIRISGEARQMLDVIFRKTYGFHKKEDQISLSQFALATGLKRPLVVRGVSKLITLNIIIIKKDNTLTNIYRINKDFDTWKPLSKKRRGYQKRELPVIKKDNLLLSKKRQTKDTLTKETIQKKDMSLFWDYFLLKTQKKFTLTDERKTLIRRRLETHSLTDLKKAVDNFVADDWEGRADHLDLIYCIGKQKGKPDNLEKWLNITAKDEKGEKLRPGTNVPEKYFKKE